eukprot:1553606-Karenia_brevis.AAC.1
MSVSHFVRKSLRPFLTRIVEDGSKEAYQGVEQCAQAAKKFTSLEGHILDHPASHVQEAKSLDSNVLKEGLPDAFDEAKLASPEGINAQRLECLLRCCKSIGLAAKVVSSISRKGWCSKTSDSTFSISRLRLNIILKAKALKAVPPSCHLSSQL